jgi:hypothetical protein
MLSASNPPALQAKTINKKNKKKQKNKKQEKRKQQ